jgi:hypothetical protein
MLLSRSGIVQRRIDSGSAAVNDDVRNSSSPRTRLGTNDPVNGEEVVPICPDSA